ncbi:MAG: AAA family ATPase [Nanoarchaeota archaeon]|nr:AAA family ATPase [Nanoarchaeota archaeon]
MALFKDILGAEETLFKNPVALDPDFMPKEIPYRENEQHYIADCIKPLFKKRNGRNLIVTGAPGIGKTAACKHILQDLEKETDEIYTIYVNCWNKNTTYKIILELCEALGYRFTQNKKTEELFGIVKGMLNKKSAVLVFDEIDKMEEFDFLYTFVEEIYRKTVVMITNYKEWITDLDQRIKSRLIPDTLEFKPYKPGEIRGILEQRMKAAFFDGIWQGEAFDIVVEKTAETGDVRTGLFLMREAGSAAEEESKRSITIEHVKKATSRMQGFSIKKDSELEESTKEILELVKSNPDMRIGELFKRYQKDGGALTYKSFQRRIQKLAENKFISVKKLMGGKDGTTTIVKPFEHKKLTEF